MIETNKVYEVDYNGHKYGLVYNGYRVGVGAGGYGKIKYMRVVADPFTGYFPQLLKTYLKANSAADIVESLLVSCKLKTFAPECITVCEHILKYGKTPR